MNDGKHRDSRLLRVLRMSDSWLLSHKQVVYITAPPHTHTQGSGNSEKERTEKIFKSQKMGSRAWNVLFWAWQSDCSYELTAAALLCTCQLLESCPCPLTCWLLRYSRREGALPSTLSVPTGEPTELQWLVPNHSHTDSHDWTRSTAKSKQKTWLWERNCRELARVEWRVKKKKRCGGSN